MNNVVATLTYCAIALNIHEFQQQFYIIKKYMPKTTFKQKSKKTLKIFIIQSYDLFN